MKKLLGLLVAGLTISAFMAGCSQPTEGDNATATGAKPAETGSTTGSSATGTTTGSTATGETTGSSATGTTPGATAPGATPGSTAPGATTTGGSGTTK